MENLEKVSKFLFLYDLLKLRTHKEIEIAIISQLSCPGHNVFNVDPYGTSDNNS